MTKQDFYLAQANYAQWQIDITPERMQTFINKTGAVNKLAENHEGFIWRYDGPIEDQAVIEAFGSRRIVFNMSVWTSIETLKAFTYASMHNTVIKLRSQWFNRLSEPTSVLWWVPSTETPTITVAKQKLAQLQAEGPSAEAFTFSRAFDADGSAL